MRKIDVVHSKKEFGELSTNEWFDWIRLHRRRILIGATTFLLSIQAYLLSEVVHEGASSTAIGLLFELSKLAFSMILYGINNTTTPRSWQSSSYKTITLDWCSFMLPASIYVTADILTFQILSNLSEPTTFEVLANMRVITTSILHKFVFQTTIINLQWAALALLCIGSATSQLVTCGHSIISNVSLSTFSMVALYAVLSACGGVSVEYMMKRRRNESLLLQNIQMHSMGVLCNAALLLSLFWNQVMEVGVIQLSLGKEGWLLGAVIINHTLCGLSVSAIIKYCDAIDRVYTHSMGMLLTMVMSTVILRQMPTIQLIFGGFIVSISLYLFYIEAEKLKHRESEEEKAY
ncbi:hypothetical protein PROFUN_09034 [Planoprotostelium fungivorum]|uniref:Uncharacterized protein n=1 Tax=Planoprotostelium fungivorum TaxID=1890364 RepID=A0A2P6MV04_9EUKA|nr:hypothetical protein PROFUN_09034 [Planoprotostelium fungivorum]